MLIDFAHHKHYNFNPLSCWCTVGYVLSMPSWNMLSGITNTWGLGSLQNTENEANFLLPLGI